MNLKDLSNDDLKVEIQKGNFERAVMLGESLGLPEKDLRELKLKALWQMSAINRNALGTKKLVIEYGLSKEELKEFLENRARQMREEGNDRPLQPRYDYQSDKYLSFEEWVENFFRNWNKLQV
jgi:hypothetical protein